MLPFYRDTVCISYQIHMDMGHLDEASSLREVAQGVVAREYHD
jgi:hypothetical protein